MKSTVVLLISIACTALARADEGMWLFNRPPVEILRERYHFEATSEWLAHLQRSSVRFSSGGSGSFVSADGLIITNQHVGSDALQKLSGEGKDFVRDGFLAKSQNGEVKCLDLELNVLDSIEDVTNRVEAAIPADVDAAKAFEARRRICAEIEKDSMDKTGLRSDVVTLWRGGAYHLYRFKRYTDVRLVFAPEQQIAFFGGDPDNFEFPRYDLDICLLRAYENGKPAKIKNYLRFSSSGAREGELVFVSGHPGHTDRLLTVAQLASMRDNGIPQRLEMLNRREVLIGAWSNRSEENARRAKGYLFGVQNSRKAIDGQLAGLLDPVLFEEKSQSENELNKKLAADSQFTPAIAAYYQIAEATRQVDTLKMRLALLEWGVAFGGESFDIARTLLRAGDERTKPNGERLPEFSDSKKVSLELDLFSERPIYTDLEILLLGDSLAYLAGKLGADDPTVKKVLAGKSPRERAAELIATTKVRDASFRHKLYDGGTKAVASADDPMIELARLVDPEARSLRKEFEKQQEIIEQAQAQIDFARNSVLGTSGYPDATFTLRLSFGTVKGYEEEGKAVPAMTTLGGLYEKADKMKEKPPYDLPPKWREKKDALDLATPLDFVSTCDIIGGNSGSPVVNREAEFVGIIFDGNLQALSWDVAYGGAQGRAISVHSAAMIEALKNIYHAPELVRELQSGAR